MGLILGALAGMGKAAGEIADANQKRWDQEEIDNRRAMLEIQKSQVLADLGYSQRRQDRADQFAEKQAHAPIERQMAVEDERAKLAVRLDPEIQRLQIEAKTRELTEQEQARLDFWRNNQELIGQQQRETAENKETEAEKEARRAQAARAMSSGAVYGEERKGLNLQANTLNHELAELNRTQTALLKDKPAFLTPDEQTKWQTRYDKIDKQITEAQTLRRDVLRKIDKLIDMDGPVSGTSIIRSARSGPSGGSIPRKDDVKRQFFLLNGGR